MKTVKTRPLFAAHEKCIKILEMIHETACRYASASSDLYAFDNSPDPFHPVKLMNTREKLVARVAHLRVLQTRLIQYYDNTMVKLIPDVLQRTMPIRIAPII